MNQPKLIWFAIAFSTVVYAIIAYTTNPTPAGSFDAAVRNPVILILYLAALSSFAAATIIPKLLQRAPAQTRMILGLAIYESCAIFGLVAAFLGHDWRLYLGPWALALIGFMRVFPGNEVTAPAP